VSFFDEAREQGDSYREVPYALDEIFIMLLGENGRGRQKCHLLSSSNGLEAGTHRYLCFTETDVAAHQSIHRPRAFHVALDLFDTAELILCLLIRKGRLELYLPFVVGRKSKTTRRFSAGIGTDETFGEFLHRFADSFCDSPRT